MRDVIGSSRMRERRLKKNFRRRGIKGNHTLSKKKKEERGGREGGREKRADGRVNAEREGVANAASHPKRLSTDFYQFPARGASILRREWKRSGRVLQSLKAFLCG